MKSSQFLYIHIVRATSESLYKTCTTKLSIALLTDLISYITSNLAIRNHSFAFFFSCSEHKLVNESFDNCAVCCSACVCPSVVRLRILTTWSFIHFVNLVEQYIFIDMIKKKKKKKKKKSRVMEYIKIIILKVQVLTQVFHT